MEIEKEILAFTSLENNWDGYGAIPACKECASNAISLIKLIRENTFCSITECYPNPNGTISLEWNKDNKEHVYVEVGRETMSYDIRVTGKNHEHYNKININSKEAKKLSGFINDLYKEKTNAL